MRRWDVSMPLFEGMPAFPGDPLFGSQPVQALARGDAYNVSRLRLSSHAGTHVDPPRHFLSDGATTDELDLDVLNGPCRVVDVPRSSRSIGAREVERLPAGAERALFRTANSERWRRALRFFDDYVAVRPDGAAALLRRGVRLVGIDALSVERDPEGKFPVHHALLSGGALILEGLLLADVPAGRYTIRCLPLAWRGGDGGPARVVLESGGGPRGFAVSRARRAAGGRGSRPRSGSRRGTSRR